MRNWLQILFPIRLCADDPGGGGPEFDPGSIAEMPVTQMLGEKHDLAAHPALKDFKGVAGLAKSFIDTQKMVGMDKSKLLTIPPDGASPEEMAEFYTKLGRPGDAKEYDFSEVAPVDSEIGFAPNEAMLEQAKARFHEMGLNGKQAQGIIDFYYRYMETEAKTIGEQSANVADAAVKQLAEEWGAAYDANLKLAQRAIAEYGSSELVQYLEETGLGNNPMLVRAFAKAGESFREADEKGGDGNASGGPMTPAQAQATISQKYADESFMKAYGDANHPNHANALAEMQKLFGMAHPNS